MTAKFLFNFFSRQFDNKGLKKFNCSDFLTKKIPAPGQVRGSTLHVVISIWLVALK